MSNVSLPENCFPAWVNVIPEREWKARLVSQISGSVDASSDGTDSRTAEDGGNAVADNSCRHDSQDAS